MNNKHKIPIKEFTKAMSEMKQKKCFVSGCSSEASDILNAHSIQRAHLLEYLADDIKGNQEVYFLDDHYVYDKENDTVASKMRLKGQLHHHGIKNASTFTGFCGKHDKQIFEIIEDNEFIGSTEQLFYHTYRAFAYSLHQEMEVNGAMTKTGREIKNLADSFETVEVEPKEDYEDQEEYDLHKSLMDIANSLIESSKKVIKSFGTIEEQGIENDKRRIQRKKWLNEILQNKSFTSFDYMTIKIPGLVPIACSSLIPHHHPMLMDVSNPWPIDLAVTVFPAKEHNMTYVIVAGSVKDFRVRSLINMCLEMDNNKVLKYISDLIMFKGYNIYLSPRMLNKMTEDDLQELIKIRLKKDDSGIEIPEIKLNLFSKKFED